MTMFPQAIGPIPAETARIARAANPKGTLAMWLRDGLGAIYTDEEFADLYPERGQPALAPWRLAVVTRLAIRGRLDGPTSCGGRARAARLEISAGVGVKRSWL